MSSSIEYIISPIEEAVDALKEVIKEHFIKDVMEQFSSPELEVDIEKRLEILNDDLYCLIEYPYVDKVYRDSYYNYYSSKHASYQRDCIRVSIFDGEITSNDFLNPVSHENLTEKYLGYFIIRPTTHALFGRSHINPKALTNNDFKICSCRSNSLVFGVKFETIGFHHSSQDEETMKCAETTIWAIMEYFGSRYIEYKPTLPSQIINTLKRFSYQRQLPSNGLTMDQISFALKEFGFGTRIYSKEAYGTELNCIIDSYIESGIPVITGLQNNDLGHVIILIGKQYDCTFRWNKIHKFVFKDEINYYDASSFPSKYVVQDDNLNPYQLIKLENPGENYTDDDDCKDFQIDSVVVPLYPKIYLETVLAKKLMLEILRDNTVGYSLGNDFIFRFFLASSRSFKQHISDLKKINIKLKKNLLLTKMPKFIWCGEFYSKNSYKKTQKTAKAIIILDATEADNKSIDALIFAGYPDRCITMNENNFVTLQQKFKNYSYFSNLK